MPNPVTPRIPGADAAAASRPTAPARREPEAADPGLKSACEGMESLFISHMHDEMRKTEPKSGFMSGGQAVEIYTSLMDAELAKQMAGAGGLGLSTVLLEQLSRSEAGPSKPSRP